MQKEVKIILVIFYLIKHLKYCNSNIYSLFKKKTLIVNGFTFFLYCSFKESTFILTASLNPSKPHFKYLAATRTTIIDSAAQFLFNPIHKHTVLKIETLLKFSSHCIF
jgi:hypothetical protein